MLLSSLFLRLSLCQSFRIFEFEIRPLLEVTVDVDFWNIPKLIGDRECLYAEFGMLICVLV